MNELEIYKAFPNIQLFVPPAHARTYIRHSYDAVQEKRPQKTGGGTQTRVARGKRGTGKKKLASPLKRLLQKQDTKRRTALYVACAAGEQTNGCALWPAHRKVYPSPDKSNMCRSLGLKPQQECSTTYFTSSWMFSRATLQQNKMTQT